MGSTERASRGGWVNPKHLPKGPNGRALCRQCSIEVPKGRRTFCSDECVDRWKVKTDPAHLRRLTFQRDRGVCAICGIDTTAIEEAVFRAETWKERQALKALYGIPEGRYRNYWDADHIVPVIEGGGECDLDNIRTLCLPCHRKATAELAARRAEPRRAEREAARAEEQRQRRLKGRQPLPGF